MPCLSLLALVNLKRWIRARSSSKSAGGGHVYDEIRMRDSFTEASAMDTSRDSASAKPRIRIVTNSPQHFHHIQKDTPFRVHQSRQSYSIVAVPKKPTETSARCSTSSCTDAPTCGMTGPQPGIDTEGERKNCYDLIPLRSMHVTFVSGLRGAVSFACATGMYICESGGSDIVRCASG